MLSPALRLAHRVFISNEEGRMHVSQQLFVRFMRGASHHEADVARREIGLNIRQALVQKNIVPKIGMRKIRDSREVHDQRQAK
jgi:hypothetical protein